MIVVSSSIDHTSSRGRSLFLSWVGVPLVTAIFVEAFEEKIAVLRSTNAVIPKLSVLFLQPPPQTQRTRLTCVGADRRASPLKVAQG